MYAQNFKFQLINTDIIVVNINYMFPHAECICHFTATLFIKDSFTFRTYLKLTGDLFK